MANLRTEKLNHVWSSVVLLWAEFERAESFWAEKIGLNSGFWQFGPNTQKGRKQLGRMLFGPKMAETSPLARARFGPLELVSAIFIEIKCHSLLHSSGNKLKLAEVLILTFIMVKYNFCFASWWNIFIFWTFDTNYLLNYSKEGVNPMQTLTNMAKYYSKMACNTFTFYFMFEIYIFF